MEPTSTHQLSETEARLIEQLRSNPQMREPLEALLKCAMAEYLGQAPAHEAEQHIITHMKALGLAALHGWARQGEARCEQNFPRQNPGATRRGKKKRPGTAPSAM